MRVNAYLFNALTGLAVFFLISSSSFAQSDDVTYGGVAAPGHVSASLGLTYGNTRTSFAVNTLALEGKTNDYLLPEIDVEAGLFDRVSLELVTGYRKVVSKGQLTVTNINKILRGNKTEDGLNPIMLGANIGITKEHGYLPAMYLKNQFYLPNTGKANFQNTNLGYFADLNFENTLSDVTCLDYSLGAGADGNDPQTIYNFNLNPNFTISDYVTLYAEFGGTYVNHNAPVNIIDIGANFSITDLFSVDVMLGNELQTKSFTKSSFGALKFCFDFNAF
ncbi:MAG: hypothetical protein LWX07_09755 [Bacteroidetes bacterium]|nr:hypothetical protein [Bacteroidota bacterium]